MKKTLSFFLALACGPFIVHAQMVIQNPGFDTLSINGTDTMPMFWSRFSAGGVNVTTDAFGPPYAMKIFTTSYLVPGQLIYGSSSIHYNGEPMIGSPIAMTGYYKYIVGNHAGADTARVRVTLTHFDQLNGNTDTLATGTHDFYATSNYTAFTVPINFGASGLAPDTLHIRFQSGIHGHCDSTTSNGTCSFLYVDELSLQYPNAVVPLGDHHANPRLTYDANAHQLVCINAAPNARIQVTNALGQTVMDYLNTDAWHSIKPALPAGIYLYRITGTGTTNSGAIHIQ